MEEFDRPETSSDEGKFIRVIVADTQAIFRAGLRKIFAVEDDIRVVGQAETLAQTLTQPFSGEVLIFESALAKSRRSGDRTTAGKTPPCGLWS